MSTTLIGALERELAERRESGRWRVRRTLASPQGPRAIVDGAPVVAFASNDYLGLANDPAVIDAAREGASRWGAGAGAAHLVCGHQEPHAELERALAEFVAPCAGARALLFSSGYLANLAIVTALVGRGDAVFADRLNHACLNDGALLARADLVRYPHLDAEALAQRLAASRAPRKLIATDAVFSMDGDIAPLARLLELAEAHDAWLVADDAHGFGVRGEGRGSVAAAGLASERIVVMGTLGKAAGVAGAFVAAHPAVIETIVQGARAYVYTTAAPAMLACALAVSLAAIRDGHERRARLAARIAQFRAGAQALRWDLLPSSTPIQPLVVGGDAEAVALSRALLARGVFVPAIRPPTVPEGSARLRISLSAAHEAADVDLLLAALREAEGRAA
ncbi:MAG: 8-amino-7-oxononanoate synthase [Betaproteobacteria bacterium]|nr:8-amino-7-oxononanoate synthase [Betaproteobacteria bacterium]